MTTTEPVPHSEEVRHKFEAQMAEERHGAVALGGLVLENQKRVAEAMLANDLELAKSVIDADDEVDAKYEELETAVFHTLALQQPVAGDLRLLVSLTRILYELERTGDLVVNCAKMLQRSEGFDLSPRLRGVLTTLTTEASALFARSLDALADLDGDLGAQLDADDDVVDETAGEWFEGMTEAAENHGVEGAILLSRIGRFQERIADHAVNIGQHVTYIVTGEFPEGHSSAD